AARRGRERGTGGRRRRAAPARERSAGRRGPADGADAVARTRRAPCRRAGGRLAGTLRRAASRRSLRRCVGARGRAAAACGGADGGVRRRRARRRHARAASTRHLAAARRARVAAAARGRSDAPGTRALRQAVAALARRDAWADAAAAGLALARVLLRRGQVREVESVVRDVRLHADRADDRAALLEAAVIAGEM